MSSANMTGLTVTYPSGAPPAWGGRRARTASASLAEMPARAGGEDERLDSWKEIAAHLNRSVRSVQRWERVEGMPVHRHGHNRTASIYAYRGELDTWRRSRSVQLVRGLLENEASSKGACNGNCSAIPSSPAKSSSLRSASRERGYAQAEFAVADDKVILVFVCQRLEE